MIMAPPRASSFVGHVTSLTRFLQPVFVKEFYSRWLGECVDSLHKQLYHRRRQLHLKSVKYTVRFDSKTITYIVYQHCNIIQTPVVWGQVRSCTILSVMGAYQDSVYLLIIEFNTFTASAVHRHTEQKIGNQKYNCISKISLHIQNITAYQRYNCISKI